MIYKDILELQNLFTKALLIARAENKYEHHRKIDEYELAEIMKKAFPKLSDEEALDLARRDLGIKTQN